MDKDRLIQELTAEEPRGALLFREIVSSTDGSPAETGGWQPASEAVHVSGIPATLRRITATAAGIEIELATSADETTRVTLIQDQVDRFRWLLEDPEDIEPGEVEGEVAAGIWSVILETLIEYAPGEDFVLQLVEWSS